MTCKETFKNLDLKKQLTEDLKNTWYYQQIKWGLKINKKSVIFDGDFKFKVEYHEHHWEDGEFEDDYWMTLDYYIKDDKDKTMMFINDDDKYMDNSTDILQNILLYIANYI